MKKIAILLLALALLVSPLFANEENIMAIGGGYRIESIKYKTKDDTSKVQLKKNDISIVFSDYYFMEQGDMLGGYAELGVNINTKIGIVIDGAVKDLSDLNLDGDRYPLFAYLDFGACFRVPVGDEISILGSVGISAAVTTSEYINNYSLSKATLTQGTVGVAAKVMANVKLGRKIGLQVGCRAGYDFVSYVNLKVETPWGGFDKDMEDKKNYSAFAIVPTIAVAYTF